MGIMGNYGELWGKQQHMACVQVDFVQVINAL
jgi:hypothetical protein